MCSPDDLTNDAFPFATAREIEIGMGLARAHRISYVGELGWELYVSTDQAAHVFETLTEAGADHGLKLCGLHALDSCRIEKAFRHFGHDITDEDHVLEAGLGFAVRTQKPDFIGRDAVLRKREEGLERRMVQFQLTDPNRCCSTTRRWCATADRVHRDLRQLRPRARRGHRHGLCPLPRRDRRRRSGFHLRDRSGRCAPRGEGQPRAALRSQIGKGADVTTEVETKKSRRGGGRAARVALRSAPLAEDQRPVRPGLSGGQYKPLTEAEVARIHSAVLDALEVVGLSQAPKAGSRS
jgi:hypothetical protein